MAPLVVSPETHVGQTQVTSFHWDAGITWRVGAQCAIYVEAKRDVDVYECLVEHLSDPANSPLRSSTFWKFVPRNK